MSLENKSILDFTVAEIMDESWDFMILVQDLWKAVCNNRTKPDENIIPEIKERIKKIEGLVDELPL